ncbi:MAG: cell division protein FtsZ [Candidatus Magasanikbacteria bacterium RIFOXYC2_FULL_40_16]|uniref:Cell division protein FtsZ n=3 Tax=Candidatus Magasanikiibacteriota TaxID=1752731 RepID=A0A1F6NI11_9BACT|nr:MAG: cell division protein FtsZ [Candidatus Magasanikbacteria bacterium RIFOXYA2_FULL_40_20]OGH83434.1 MAG: cell division protein FtsZ [Candidatus Magasanikbacteria bacterium RIFOXYB1_FULL_40_15]OGH86903.1 MAG: cell division protein FtsZ [Candidatus Magasanikbacteria bacterium RIFOXYB2_FULL_40_13]OGH87042.1 MAG: cell division protein FtsZ [Candidatus Magasanikbacteria bacterium RIFOXYA1_FULL_40_8]OGH90305.1 MAG: cell division protein FtsZ [Candidatus Magasanikbacteria bacterium RIFOXYC2_FULL
MPQIKPDIETFAKIKVVGVGGSGGSAVDRMVKTNIRGVDFVAMNTDVQALHHNSAENKLHIGKTITRGLGAGMDPEMGKRSAEEARNEIREVLKDSNMVFITCGLGGGTGSGASPVIAEIAREVGALTVAVVTKPFGFEGPQRKAIAEQAYEELARKVDTIITIPNDRVLQIIDKKTSLLEAFKIVDDVLRQGVQGISELITVPGLINVDFADVKSIMSDTGSALMGIGYGTGENRAVEAAKAAISSPLLELSIEGAKGILFTITGGTNLGMQEVSEAAEIITEKTDKNVKVIFGTVIDESMGDDIRITVIATGFEDRERKAIMPDNIDINGAYTGKKSFYPTSIFTKKNTPKIEEKIVMEEDEEEDDDVVGVFNKKPLETVKIEEKKKDDNNADEEDLEIPAFIRKKMGL